MIRTGQDVAIWVYQRLGTSCNGGGLGIGLERDGALVAGVCYEDWNKRSIMAHIVVMGRLTRYYLYAIFHYPFEYLGVEKIICPIPESNAESIRLATKMGFKREATIADAHPDGNLYLYTLMRSNCRFTGERYGKKFVTAAAA